MPRVVGVIAEYNPFHAGHAWHLQEARRLSGADYVVVVMSACFTQRGDAALLSPACRTEMALACGADAVFALPAVWSVRDAEHFSLGGVALLDALGCDAISFGSEAASIEPLYAAAQLLENQDGLIHSALQSRLTSGIPYPAAIAEAAEAVYSGAGDLLSQPNSTLAICYLRAMLRLNSQMEVIPVPRSTSYHSTVLDDAFPSATAVRGAVLRGDWQSAKRAMPDAACRILQKTAAEGHLHRPGALDSALMYRLRTMLPDEYTALPDVSEGIENRLCIAAMTAHSREELLLAAKTRRYPFSRLSRLATHALLGFTHHQLTNLALPNAAWLLGFRKVAQPLVSHLNNAARLPIIARSSALDDTVNWFESEARAQDVWSLGAGLPGSLLQSHRVVTL